MHCLKKHHFPWKTEGERVEKLLPVEFTAWLEVVGAVGGSALPSSGRWHFHISLLGRAKKAF